MTRKNIFLYSSIFIGLILLMASQGFFIFVAPRYALAVSAGYWMLIRISWDRLGWVISCIFFASFEFFVFNLIEIMVDIIFFGVLRGFILDYMERYWLYGICFLCVAIVTFFKKWE